MTMAQMHASKDQLQPERVGIPQLGDYYEWRMSQFGDYCVRFESIPADFDDAELLKGLPDDACPCAHWGYLFKGRMRFRYTDGSEDDVVSGGRPTMPDPDIPSRP